jgi:type I restriction enzyme M protein
LTDEDIAKIAGTYHAWRGEKGAGEYADIPGFCKSAALEEIKGNGYVLTPGGYVGTAQEAAEEFFSEKIKRLATQLEAQREEGAKLDEMIKKNLEYLGLGGE